MGSGRQGRHYVIQDASSADTEKPPPMSAISRSMSCEEIVDPNHCDRHHPESLLSRPRAADARRQHVRRSRPAAGRSLPVLHPMAARSRRESKSNPPDNRHMLQAGRQFVPELTSVAEPEAVPDHRRQNRKAGEQQGAQPCKESSGDEASADELGKDGGTRESRRPRQSVALTSSMLERQFQSLSTAL